MREHYFRMQTYPPYFDSRLAWYPKAWAYKDSYAIRPDWPVFREHPEWVLRDGRGRMLYIDWDCRNWRCPQYAADIGNRAFRRWWIDDARDLVERGYAGLWIDDVNMTWRLNDGKTNKARAIDPRTGKIMTLRDWRRYFADFMTEIRTALPQAEIAHNAIWYAGPADDPTIARQIEAADYINLERGATDKGLRGGAGRWGLQTFFTFVDAIHRQRRAVILMDYGATSTEREYGLAAWLLISRGRDLMSSNRPEWTVPGHWWPGYSLDLGRARGNRYPWQGVLRRDFDCGTVLLNQPDMPGRKFMLGAGFRDLAGAPVAVVTLPARHAAILQQPCSAGR
jgi:hypothetical protein